MQKMNRRELLVGVAAAAVVSQVGCRGVKAHVMNPWEKQSVGSDKAGGEIYNPIVAAATSKLLARSSEFPISNMPQLNANGFPPKRRVCFVGIENLSAEELGDFKDHISATINQQIVEADQFDVVHNKALAAGLTAIGARPEDLFLPVKRRQFTQVMEQEGNPIDYLLFAKITSGTTQDNKDMQREYKLTMELVDAKSSQATITESCTMRKEYNKSVKGKAKSWFKK